MGNLAENLMEELQCETVFSIGGIGISESVVVTWIIMAVVLIACLLATRRLKVENPGRGQLLLEFAVSWIQNLCGGFTGEEGKRYAPYLTSVLIYLGIANLIGILGFKPPTKDLNVTAALAIMSIVLIQYAGIHKKGVKGIGAGIGIGIATSKATEAVARQPEADGKITKILLLGAALAEATAIYGFVVALLIIILLG